MRKLTNILSIALISGALFLTIPARAQSVDNTSGSQAGIAEVDEDNDDTDWGWLGLLGLIGLYGLKGKDGDKRHIDTKVNR